jgi:hypothetical protein
MEGIKSALNFIAEGRKNDQIREQIAAERTSSLAGLVKIGENSGFTFTAEDLKTAFKYDWQMRWHRFNP